MTIHPPAAPPEDVMDASSPHTFGVKEPEMVTSPLVFASPHSGRFYPETFLSACRADLMELRRIEDAYVDLLFDGASAIGAPFLYALVGRACVDLNRAANELDIAMFSDPVRDPKPSRSARVIAGLGCIPRIAHGGVPIYRRKLTFHEARQRLDQIYHPYHTALDDLLDRTRAQFGASILIDCHSMPSESETGQPMPDIILGDRFGASCSPDLTDQVEQALTRRGFSVARNTPYAGGHITVSRGKPERQRHALQIELNRKLYLDEVSVELKSTHNRLRDCLNDAFSEVNTWARAHMTPASPVLSRP